MLCINKRIQTHRHSQSLWQWKKCW